MRLLRTFDRAGALGWLEPEVLSPATQAMPAAHPAQRAGGWARELVIRPARSGPGCERGAECLAAAVDTHDVH
ncbi:hypothetical protein FRAHR75_1770002 [Frankia sp. Hr75.2]|nr:hypothetical protein FRAHR75_1770002 [Frankia sp. Hr75.2]